MAYLLKSNDVYIDDEVIAEQDPIEFRNGRNLGSLPTLYDENWGYVESANQWFIHLKANKRLESLSSYARALLHYWNFIESEGLIWDVFPLAKGLKPTYRYRNDKLLKSIKAGELACSTANTYMTHVVQFYLWAAHERYYHISERHKPFEIEFVRIHRSDMLAHMMPKFLIQTTDLRIRTPRDATSKNIRGLKPLTQIALTHLALHLRNAPCEFRLICLLAAQCGFRIQEASGLTLAALEQSVQRSGSITHFELTIGPGNGVPTKYNKTRTIEITSRLLSDLKTYAISERRMCRLDKLLSRIELHKGINDIKNPTLFISQRKNSTP